MTLTPKYFRLPDWSIISVNGADRQAFVNKFCTNDLAKLNVGDGCETFFTDVKGKVVAHAVAAVLENSLRLTTVPHHAPGLIQHLDRYCIREDVQFVDDSGGTSAWHLIGLPADGRERPENEWSAAVDDDGAVAQRLGWPVEPAWLVTSPQAAACAVEDKWIKSGAAAGTVDEWEAWRLDAGWPLFGVDFGPDALPQEVGRDSQAISFRKGCYLGQETVARIDALGHVNRRLRLVAGDDPAARITVGDVLFLDEKPVGALTSRAMSSRLGRPVGMAMLRREAVATGTRLTCGGAVVQVIEAPLL